MRSIRKFLSSLEDFQSFVFGNLRTMYVWLFIEWRKLGIKSGEIVADFGCGGRPLLRADILVDKFLSGLTERALSFVDNGAYIIQCDLKSLPFKNKSLDFVYCSHVVEHLENLKVSLLEMERVGKKGFITCPSALREQIVALKMHVWLVEKNRGKLIFTRKKKPFPDYIGDFFEKFIVCKKSYYWHNFERKFSDDIFYINHFWNKKINFEVEKDRTKDSRWKVEGETEFLDKQDFFFWLRGKILLFSSIIIRKFAGGKINIKEVLCCPLCRGELLFESDKVICQKCDRLFKSEKGRIFYFLG